MELTSEETQYLAKRLIKDEQLVTYHSFSHDLGVHVNRAKKLLCEFYKTHRDRLSAAFIVSGIQKGSGESLVKYCNDERAMENAASSLFTTIYSIFVYGLVSKRMADAGYGPDEFASVEALIKTSFEDRIKYYKCGMFSPSVDITEGQISVETARPLASKPTATPRENTKSPLKPVVSAGLTSGYVSRKAKPVDLSTESPAAYTSARKRAASEKIPPAPYQYKSRKTEPKRDRVIASTSEAVEDSITDSAISRRDAVKSKQQAAELEKMFDQSFTALEDEVETAEPIAIEHEAEQNVPGPQELEHMEVDSEPELESRKTGSINKHFAPSREPQERCALFVTEEELKPQDAIDEDGFITLYSAKKSSSRPSARSKPQQTKVNAKSKPQKLNTGTMKQGNLMSFFGK